MATTYTTILKSGIDDIFIVVPEIENIIDEAKRLTKNIIVHANRTNKGIGSSIKFGTKYIRKNRPQTRALLLALCDQPFIKPQEYAYLYEMYEISKLICASSYADTIGAPCIIPSRYFDDLISIDDHKGAKEFLYREIKNLLTVPLSSAQYDIDDRKTLDKFLHLKNKNHHNSIKYGI